MGFRENGEVRTCHACGKMFLYYGIGEVLCEPCRKIDTEIFEKVKEYIYSNPDATIKDTSEATGVKIRKITKYIRENKLIIPDKSAVFISCESCGGPIKSGRICKTCALELSPEQKKEMHLEDYHVGDSPDRKNAKMHFANKNIFKKK